MDEYDADCHATPTAIYPTVATARRLALLSAALPGADEHQLDRLAAIEAICDAHGLDGAAHAALIMREAVAWPAVYAWCWQTRRWTTRKVNRLMATELLDVLAADLAVARSAAFVGEADAT